MSFISLAYINSHRNHDCTFSHSPALVHSSPVPQLITNRNQWLELAIVFAHCTGIGHPGAPLSVCLSSFSFFLRLASYTKQETGTYCRGLSGNVSGVYSTQVPCFFIMRHPCILAFKVSWVGFCCCWFLFWCQGSNTGN